MRNWIVINKYFLISLFLTATLFFNIGTLNVRLSKKENPANVYSYLAPRLFQEEKNDLIINFTQLREVMKQRYEERNLPVGVYFEYLPTGSSIGVNDKMEIEIGSLGKVPASMAVFKAIEYGRLSLDTELTIEKKHLDDQFGDLWEKGEGTKITVLDAINLALKESDNTAINVLLDRIDAQSQDSVFDELDLPKRTDGLYPVMSPKSFASVFRNLYLSSFLSYEHSNSILDKLTKTKFNDKIPAGLPLNVSMSHKIGVFSQSNGQTVYNDCGIVYVPERPYVLCIMSVADEETAREEMIAYSKMVYSYVSQVQTSK